MKLSKRQWDRLRVMYTFNLITRHHNVKPDDVFNNKLNPQWLQMKDVLSSPHYENRQIPDCVIKHAKESGKADWGCFKVRKTAKGYVIYTELARVKEART